MNIDPGCTEREQATERKEPARVSYIDLALEAAKKDGLPGVVLFYLSRSPAERQAFEAEVGLDRDAFSDLLKEALADHTAWQCYGVLPQVTKGIANKFFSLMESCDE